MDLSALLESWGKDGFVPQRFYRCRMWRSCHSHHARASTRAARAEVSRSGATQPTPTAIRDSAGVLWNAAPPSGDAPPAARAFQGIEVEESAPGEGLRDSGSQSAPRGSPSVEAE
eukprot:6918856-Alexandrium_andersonii.AAC.1